MTKIYITKSAEVAGRIALSYRLGEDGVARVSYGCIGLVRDLVPERYRDRGYYQCTVEYKGGDRPTCEIIIA